MTRHRENEVKFKRISHKTLQADNQAFRIFLKHTDPSMPPVELSKKNISFFIDRLLETKTSEKPRITETGDVKFEYQWIKSAQDIVDVNLIVTETHENANKYLTQKFSGFASTIWIIPPIDNPNIAGHISYDGGRLFIRDNIVLEIDIQGEMRSKTADIAKQIDSLLLRAQTFPSSDFIKPVIVKFEITQNPVQRMSFTKMIVKIRDPLEAKIYFDWNFSSSGRILKIHPSEDYLFYTDTKEQFETIQLTILNEYGFFSSAGLEIKIKD